MPTSETGGPRVPDVGSDPREATSDLEPPAGKTWFRDLDEAVIEADRCVQCGTCVAACPSDSIGIADSDSRPTLVKMCTGCSRCWDTCPRAGLRYERLPGIVAEDGVERSGELGQVRNALAARAADPADGRQHGGVVTALLGALLADPDGIDGAIVAEEGTDGTARPTLVTTPAQARATAGSLFTQPLSLAALEEVVADPELPTDPSLALVGTPCVIEGVAALEYSPYRDPDFDEERPLDAIELTIGLMCTQAFDRDRLNRVLDARWGTSLVDVDSMNVVGDGVRVDTGETVHQVSLSDLSEAVLAGCEECADFTARTADVSVGTIGSRRGRSTVLVRTDRGRAAWDRAADAIEAEPLETRTPLSHLAEWNRERAMHALERNFDPAGSLAITYDQHRDAYDGTDRAPVELNPARVHQYEEWC